MPHRPMITLGMAASISIMNEPGPRIHLGASSLKKMAVPRLIGTANIKASKELAMVPNTAGMAPKISLTGSQVEVVKNDVPNLCIEGQA